MYRDQKDVNQERAIEFVRWCDENRRGSLEVLAECGGETLLASLKPFRKWMARAEYTSLVFQIVNRTGLDAGEVFALSSVMSRANLTVIRQAMEIVKTRDRDAENFKAVKRYRDQQAERLRLDAEPWEASVERMIKEQAGRDTGV